MKAYFTTHKTDSWFIKQRYLSCTSYIVWNGTMVMKISLEFVGKAEFNWGKPLPADRDSNPRHREYKAEVLIIQPRRLATKYKDVYKRISLSCACSILRLKKAMLSWYFKGYACFRSPYKINWCFGNVACLCVCLHVEKVRRVFVTLYIEAILYTRIYIQVITNLN
jgi:hypothetical protein